MSEQLSAPPAAAADLASGPKNSSMRPDQFVPGVLIPATEIAPLPPRYWGHPWHALYERYQENVATLFNKVFCAPADEFPGITPLERTDFALENVRPHQPRRFQQLPGLPPVPPTPECLYYCLDPLDSFSILSWCTNPARRRALYRAYAQLGWRGPLFNLPLLQKILTARAQEARAQGCENFLAARFEDKMEKSPEKISAFLLADLKKNLPAEEAYWHELTAFAHRQGLAPVRPWDLYYVERLWLEEKFPAHRPRFNSYFELTAFVPKLLAWVGELFEITFTPTGGRFATGTVDYLVQDVPSARALGTVRFNFFTQNPGVDRSENYYYTLNDPGSGADVLPDSEVYMSYSKEAESQKYLLGYNGIEALLHELGHVLENIFAASAPGPTGTRELDTHETLSTLMEYFLTAPTMLAKLSAHYQTGAPLPAAKLAELQALRAARAPRKRNRDITKALVDLRINAAPARELVSTFQAVVRHTGYTKYHYWNLCVEKGLFRNPDDSDYPGNYYTYHWGAALAKKLFAPFAGLTPPYPPGLGRALREEVFAQSDKRPFAESFRRFTGKNLTY